MRFIALITSVLLPLVPSLPVVAGATDRSEIRFVERARIAVAKPAFLSLAPAPNGEGSSELLISSFGLFGRDAIFRLLELAGALNGDAAVPSVLTREITWPNEVSFLPSSVFGAEGLLVSSGFLFPTKRTGAVSFVDRSTGRILALTRPKAGYFYHRAVTADVSGTGRVDVIAARARIPFFGGARDGELVWLIRPAAPLDGPWEERVLARGPDIHFRLARDPASKRLVALAAEFGARRISAHAIAPDGRVERRVIDDTLGSPFDLQLVDLDGDGRDELLVTNHEPDARAAVFAYTPPADWMTGAWERHTLLSGIETRQRGIRQASPGAAKAFHPVLGRRGREKPWIVVSGDGSQRLHLLTPASEAPRDWRYRETILLDTKSTVGEPLVLDIDGDGYADIAVPAYDANLLFLLSAKPR